MRLRTMVAMLALVMLAGSAPARSDIFHTERFSLYGDFRFRAETDWDSQDAAGLMRPDRTRLRVRLRVGFRYDPTEHWRVEARLRSGPEGSQQSPNVTILQFDDGETGDASFNLDRWYLRGTISGFYAWAGRNDLPFWKQDELLFDDDVTMTGVGLGWGADVGRGKLSVAGGYFTTPVGMVDFSGNLAGLQVAYQPELAGVRWSFALGGYFFDANRDDLAALGLLQGNGFRDYSILEAAVQARWSAGGRPLVLGADWMHNLEDYQPDDPDPVTAANHDQTDGYLFLATYGSLDARDQWLVGYYYAHIETLAVNNSYAQDDWVRWGSSTQTRASNMKGHELRFGWAFSPKMNLLTRLYLVDSITTIEDGNRLRVDFNYRF